MKPFTEVRPWGEFRQFTHDEPTTVKIITVKPHEAFSLQYHQKRAEFWRVLSGNGKVTAGDRVLEAKVGDEYTIEPTMKHRIEAGNEALVVLEIASGVFDEQDIIRIEDRYGRA